MADSAEKMRDTILNIITNNYEIVWGGIDEEEILSAQSIYKMTDMIVAALSASGTKSDGGAEVASSAAPATRGEQRDRTHGTMPVGGNAENSARTDRSPSDPIPSQPDERERVKQVIELAMIEEAEIQYADFTDRDRQREKIIANAADAILAMLAERRADNTVQRDRIYRAAERSNTRFGQWMPERWVNIFVEELNK